MTKALFLMMWVAAQTAQQSQPNYSPMPLQAYRLYDNAPCRTNVGGVKLVDGECVQTFNIHYAGNPEAKCEVTVKEEGKAMMVVCKWKEAKDE